MLPNLAQNPRGVTSCVVLIPGCASVAHAVDRRDVVVETLCSHTSRKPSSKVFGSKDRKAHDLDVSLSGFSTCGSLVS